MKANVIHAACEDAFRDMDCASFDCMVTDPPYGLRFMGKRWDYDVPRVEVWEEAWRVVKPGGHLLCFAGSRTSHRMAVRIEDAGWEIRDTLLWIYGSGWPKSLDVGKAIDKAAGATREVVGRHATGRSATPRNDMRGGAYVGSKKTIDLSAITAPATPEAARWTGWGTALKPAYEPIILARKPLEGTVAANVLRHGTGAINIDGCRVESDGSRPSYDPKPEAPVDGRNTYGGGLSWSRVETSADLGRWPANVLHDGSDEATEGMGAAARYFYCAKASKADRGPGNNHPTVKPHELMRWLVRLVAPPGGKILDPYCGSGSTLKAAMVEGFDAVGIEQDAESVATARRRLAEMVPASPGRSLF